MGLRSKPNAMLHQISWFTYSVSILSVIAVYYLYIGLTFYKIEIQSSIYKLTGKQPAVRTAGNGDLQLPDYGIMGKAQPDHVEFVNQEELTFGPADYPDEVTSQLSEKAQGVPGTESQLIGDFSEMVSEVKTLIRVINESSESKENFEMLFRLIVQKHSALAGTAYQEQVNDFLIEKGGPEFPFSLSIADLNNYWTNEN
jgi:hypothetical protein